MRLVLTCLILIAVAAVAGGIVYLMWDLDWRWRPHTITKDQDVIAKALDQSGWVSPHLTGPKVYVIVYPGCQTCATVLPDAMQKLQAADVDTRMVVVARADQNGQTLSTSQDRALTAELWTNRSWKLFQQVFGTQSGPIVSRPDLVKPPVIPPADGDAARTAVVQVGQQLSGQLAQQLKDNGVALDYPTLIWWTKDGRMQACACTDAHAFPPVEKALTAP